MDEFIENFNKFQEWLEDYWPEEETTAKEAADEIRDKFKELGLKDAF